MSDERKWGVFARHGIDSPFGNAGVVEERLDLDQEEALSEAREIQQARGRRVTVYAAPYTVEDAGGIFVRMSEAVFP